MQAMAHTDENKNKDTFINSTYFIIPFCFDNYAELIGALERSPDWMPNTFKIDYLLSYASRIAETPGLFLQFSLRNTEYLPVDSYQNKLMEKLYKKQDRLDQAAAFEAFLENLRLSEVLISCFATGIGFLEFKVKYGTLPIDCVIDFAFYFKNTRNKPDEGKKTLLNLAAEFFERLSVGGSVRPFFYCASDMKKECLCYHLLKLTSEEKEDGKLSQRLHWLGRSYYTSFAAEQTDAELKQSKYDFRYSPYANDNWAGSQEALANLNFEVDDPSQNWFLRTYKYSHLTSDYHFLYLLILNQRFAAIRYIEQIVEPETQNIEKLKELNREIIRLKTVFSLRVISNDMLYQNVYNRMYEIMDIEQLLGDLQDNEQLIELQQKEAAEAAERQEKEAAEKSEHRIQNLLFAISILAVFSALIDAADYFDLFPMPWPGHWMSLIAVAAIVAIVIIIAFIRTKKKQ